jgi:hypothetical protein
MTLLSMYWPMWACSHALAKLSHRSEAGSDQASPKISSSLLTDARKVQRIGTIMRTVQTTSAT